MVRKQVRNNGIINMEIPCFVQNFFTTTALSIRTDDNLHFHRPVFGGLFCSLVGQEKSKKSKKFKLKIYKDATKSIG